jgi:hypothetical protein
LGFGQKGGVKEEEEDGMSRIKEGPWQDHLSAHASFI